MKFPRQSRVLRGPLDPAPLAGVFILLFVFILLASMLPSPGVLIDLESTDRPGAAVITVDRGGVSFHGTTYAATNLNALRAELKKIPPSGRLTVLPGTDAPAELTSAVRGLLRIRPPSAAHLPALDAPAIMVAVNARGQLFFNSQMMTEDRLVTELTNQLAFARRQSMDLTLIIVEDEDVDSQVLIHLCDLAEDIGFKQVVLGTQAPPFSGGPKPR